MPWAEAIQQHAISGGLGAPSDGGANTLPGATPGAAACGLAWEEAIRLVEPSMGSERGVAGSCAMDTPQPMDAPPLPGGPSRVFHV